MRKHSFAADKTKLLKMGTVLSVTLGMAVMAVGCGGTGAAGTKAETSVAADAAGSADEGRSADAAVTGAVGEAEDAAGTAGEAEDVAGTAGSSGTADADGQETQLQEAGEGDSGTEAQPGVPLKAGNKAPDFTAQLIDGSSITLSEFKGKPVIINFWATWCGPCVKEMPAFERLQADFGDKIGIIAVNCGDDADTVKDFASENGYTFPIALDEDYKINMLYPTSSIPYTVVLDANGKITHISAGAVDADTMYEKYKDALGV